MSTCDRCKTAMKKEISDKAHQWRETETLAAIMGGVSQQEYDAALKKIDEREAKEFADLESS